MALVLHHADVRGTDKVILLGIANHDGDGGAWPSVATLAKYANVTTRNVQKSLRELERLGLIRSYIQGGGLVSHPDSKRPNRYEVLVRCPEGCDRTSQHRVSQTTPPVADDTPTPVEFDTPTPVADDTLTIPEPSFEPSENPPYPPSGDLTGARYIPPGPPQAGGDCSRHPNGDGVNCRGCGTTNRQRARSESREAAALRRAQDAEELRKARESKPAPEVAARGAMLARELLHASKRAG